jgi:farnesyl diphosphate synthase
MQSRKIPIDVSCLLRSSISVLFQKFMRQQPYYFEVIEIFNATSFQTELGQLLHPDDKLDLSNISFDKYYICARYKTASYSFYIPVALAMYLAGVATPDNLRQAKVVLMALGVYSRLRMTTSTALDIRSTAASSEQIFATTSAAGWSKGPSRSATRSSAPS